tara:strand:+ start:5191 stop:6210 length:1020 start_codon:yes stop_codon:yes gene_type:complete
MTPETNMAEDLSAAFDEIEGTDETGEVQSEQEDQPEVEVEVEEEFDQAPDEAPEVEEGSEPEVSDESEVATESSDSKAPVSWKATAREDWAKIPDGARQEIQRRETDISRTLQESANARGFTNEFSEVVQPYMAFIKAENSTPLNAVSNLMQTAAGLRIGSPAQKAQIIHSIMQDHAVDVQMLDQLLVGEEPQAMTPDQIDQLVDQRVAMATGMQQNTGDQVFEQDMANAHEAIEVFASDPKNEFFEDVRADMIYLLQSSAQKGQKMTLEQSYNEAIRLSPEIQGIVGGRPSASNGAARRKKAASSIKSGAPSGRGATGGAGKTLADDLAATWAAFEEG